MVRARRGDKRATTPLSLPRSAGLRPARTTRFASAKGLRADRHDQRESSDRREDHDRLRNARIEDPTDGPPDGTRVTGTCATGAAAGTRGRAPAVREAEAPCAHRGRPRADARRRQAGADKGRDRGLCGGGRRRACRAAALETKPDICLLDLRMPGGVAAAWEIGARLPTTKIVVLTASDDDSSLFAALRAGAVGYLVKDLDLSLLPRACRTSSTETPRSRAGSLPAWSSSSTRTTRDSAPRPSWASSEPASRAANGTFSRRSQTAPRRAKSAAASN